MFMDEAKNKETVESLYVIFHEILRLGNQISTLVRDGKPILQSSGFKKCGPQIGSINDTWALIQDADSQAPPLLDQNLWRRGQEICVFASPAGNPDTCSMQERLGDKAQLSRLEEPSLKNVPTRTDQNCSYLRVPNKMYGSSTSADSKDDSQRAHI